VVAVIEQGESCVIDEYMGIVKKVVSVLRKGPKNIPSDRACVI